MHGLVHRLRHSRDADSDRVGIVGRDQRHRQLEIARIGKVALLSLRGAGGGHQDCCNRRPRGARPESFRNAHGCSVPLLAAAQGTTVDVVCGPFRDQMLTRPRLSGWPASPVIVKQPGRFRHPFGSAIATGLSTQGKRPSLTSSSTSGPLAPSLVLAESRSGRGELRGNSVRPLGLCRGCPRNCERRAAR